MVTGELLNPDSPNCATSRNPASFSISRNTVPGTAPPLQVNHDATMSASDMGGGPVSIWSAT